MLYSVRLVFVVLGHIWFVGTNARNYGDGNTKALHSFDVTVSNIVVKLQELEAPNTLLELYASWCPHCQRFAKHLKLVHEAIAPFPDEVGLLAIDCADKTSSPVCTNFKVAGYPTLYWGPPDTFVEVIQAGSKEARSAALKSLEKVSVARTAPAVLGFISSRIGHNITNDVEASPSAREPRTPGSLGGSSSRAPTTLPARVDFGDVQKATDLILPYGVVQELDGTTFNNVLHFYTLLARVHPLDRCRKGSLRIAQMIERTWSESTPIPSKLMEQRPCESIESGGKNALATTDESDWSACPGYTCGLWQLFHSMALNVEPHEGMIGLLTIKGMVKSLFGCSECRAHFVQAAESPAAKRVRTRRDLVLWLWKQHNSVNDRLAKEPESAATTFLYPKVQWPTVELCPSCRDGQGEWIMDHVYQYLEQFYGSQSAAVAAHKGSSVQRWLDSEVQSIEQIGLVVIVVACLGTLCLYLGSLLGIHLGARCLGKEVFVKVAAWLLVKARGKKAEHGHFY